VNNKKTELIGIVGKGNVFDDAGTLGEYSRDHSFARPRKPRFVVKPKNGEEVQGLVKWANETNTPLVPVSSGQPRFYGDTVPGVPGAVIVDLGRMKRIIRIDRRNRMALIEPGVTFSELQPELTKEGLRLSTPLLPRANKSVIGSLLERQPTLVPRYQWVILEPLRCLEVIWGNGDRLRTGEAGEYGPLETQWKLGLAQVNPMGPANIDYWRLVSAAQGSMGIAIWASIRCEILPRLHKLFFMAADQLDELIDCAYSLLRVRLGDEFLLLNSSNLAAMLGQGTDQIRALRDKLPAWVIVVGVAGRDRLPRERVEFQEKDIKGIAQQYGLEVVPAVPGASGEQVLETILNPSREPWWKLGYKSGCQDIFFLTTLNRTPEFVATIYSLAEALNYPKSDIGIYLQPQHQGVSCHCEFSLPYDPGDQEETAKVQELFTRASEELLKQGAFFSRPYGIWANMMYARDAQQTNLLRQVKGIFDPNNVMNPGKLCFSGAEETKGV
jgi:FAD/FMN-containing dehydrogenase